MKPEEKVKRAIRDFLKHLQSLGHPVWFYMPVQNGMGVTGIPDFVACVAGHLLAIETKAPGKLRTVTPNQRRQLDNIIAAGGTALVADNLPDIEPIILKLLHRKD